MDVQMPEMNGFETVKYIKLEEKDKDVPVIFVTAISKEDKYVHEGYGSGAVDYLFKPVDVTILNSKINIFKELYQNRKELKQKNEELKDFARVLSHDLKSPASQIIGLMELIKVNNPDTIFSNGSIDFLESAISVSNNMINLINGILNYNMSTISTKKEKLNLEMILNIVQCNLEKVINDAKATIEYHNLPNEIYADEAMLVQLFQNIISNSIKYQKPNNNPNIKIIGTNDSSYQSITIEDNGIGFSEDKANEIFNMFTRVHTKQGYEGYGIGLATCKKIINSLHWGITVQSEIDIGSKFILSYPILN
jgi:light-regulated signal transduction histidine kinase (bacteriophytochrome)